MAALDEFKEILSANEPLGKLTRLGIGGPAEWLARPRQREELTALVQRCHAEQIPFRLLGGGSNVLVPDEGVAGVVILLTAPAFQGISIQARQARAGAGVLLAEFITQTCQQSLSGLEDLVGIPGSVGGALCLNAGWRTGDIGQHVHSVEVMDETGAVSVRMRADLRFGYRQSNLDDAIILSAIFDLEPDNPHDIVRRIKKVWIAKKGSQPFGFQAAGYVFRNPRGLNAGELIEQTGLMGMKVGGAEISDRDPKFIIAHPGATSRDILRLIDLVRSKVEERTRVALELQIDIW